MWITITTATPRGVIAFSCSLGDGVGRLMSDSDSGVGEHDVELEIRDAVEGSTIEIVELGSEDLIRTNAADAALVDLIGLAVDLDEFDVLRLRLGPTDVLLDTDGEASGAIVGRRVRIRGLALELCSTGM